MSQRRPDLAVGLVKFYSHEELTKFLRELAEYYQKEAEKYGDKLGSMLRTGPSESAPKKEDKKQEKDDKKGEKGDPKQRPGAGGWIRMGSIMINTVNPEAANTEVMYQVHEELKVKLARTNEALKSFETSANTLIPHNTVLQLYIKNGIPERIIVETQEVKKATFNFDGKFRIV
jgi:hypothetical protein